MRFGDVLRHRLRGDYVIFEWAARSGQRNPSENPEKRRPNVLHRFHAHAARFVSRDERLHLNVGETSPALVAAQDVDVRCVAESDDR